MVKLQSRKVALVDFHYEFIDIDLVNLLRLIGLGLRLGLFDCFFVIQLSQAQEIGV